MANYTKREQNRADIITGIEAGLPPLPEPPRCRVYGAPAAIEVNRRPRVEFFCGAHRQEADAAFGR